MCLPRSPLIVTIDGPAGAGKSSVAKKIAERMSLNFLDTGALYRSVAWWLDQQGIPAQDTSELRDALQCVSVSLFDGRALVNQSDVTDVIREPGVDAKVSLYASLRPVRDVLLRIQQKEGERGVVAEGRDMGTVVFPQAQLKIFLTATAEQRAKRRYLQRLDKGFPADYDLILQQVMDRDAADERRSISPLIKAEDAFSLDTSELTFEQVVDCILALAEKRGLFQGNE